MTRVNDAVPPVDALAIAAILVEYCYLVDHGRAAECPSLFAPNASLTFGAGTSKPITLAGIEAIRGFFENRQAQTHVTTRHIPSNFRMTARTDGKIEVDSILSLYRSEDAAHEPIAPVIADVHDVLSRSQDGFWKIETRVIAPIFVKA
jgi:hypothetical protein